jgi:DNA-binding MarR family transcriptional regulator
MWVFFSLFMEDTMLQDAFMKVYTKFKLHFYAKFFERIQERETSLTTVETFCMEIIYSINNPTVNEFAKVANISSPNAAYKVNNLIKKGYLRKVQSEVDKREFHLEVTDKYMRDYGITYDYMNVVMQRIRQRFAPEEVEQLESMLKVIGQELMPEVTLGRKFE